MNCLRKIISLIIFGVVFINAQGGTTRDSWNYRLSQLNGSYYAYDDNGNMTADGRQGLEMEYNVLNLPRRIEDAQTGVGVSYSYLADGTKAEMRRDDGTGLAYAGDMVFTRSANGAYTFESAAYCNGRVLANGTTQKFVTDHLGSVRAVVTGGQVVERNDYYPLGMRHPNPSYAQLAANRYGYNGKEREDIASNGTYLDYGARFLDPVLGRWTTCDPMADKYLSLTPYNFCGNDPVNYVDMTGKLITVFGDESFTRYFYEYRHFLEINGLGDYFKALDNSTEIYTIQETRSAEGGSFHPKSKTIRWNPYHIYLSSNNTALSPAVTLIHEIGHAYNYEQCRKNNKVRDYIENTLPASNNAFGSIEEENVINNIEIPAAKILKEINSHQVTRYNHDEGKGVYDASNLSPFEASSYARDWNDFLIPMVTRPNFDKVATSPIL